MPSSSKQSLDKDFVYALRARMYRWDSLLVPGRLGPRKQPSRIGMVLIRETTQRFSLTPELTTGFRLGR